MLRHCTIAELLDLRDGEGSAVARAHVDECDACRAELDRLHQRVAVLKALPSFTPPRDRWPVVRDTLAQARRRSRWQRAGGAALAAAAALALMIGIPGVRGSGPDAAIAQEVDELKQESHQLEQVLHEVERERRVVNGRVLVVIVGLEDRIAVIDAGIATVQTGGHVTVELRDLWEERVILVNQLVVTHVQQTAYVGH
jgi:predicted anti-sigma-YlaC factor YlaD